MYHISGSDPKPASHHYNFTTRRGSPTAASTRVPVAAREQHRGRQQEAGAQRHERQRTRCPAATAAPSSAYVTADLPEITPEALC
jgi:hypothetical protein